MKRSLILFFLLLSVCSKGQIFYPAGIVFDSTTFTFAGGDSLMHFIGIPTSWDTMSARVDTTGTRLWQIGNTLKPAFSNGIMRAGGIMTDTLHPYPANANDHFTLMIANVPNFVVSVWHRYTTDSLHAGGTIEFSTDTGATWMNIAECGMILKENMYALTDTLNTGLPAFMGKSNGQILTRFQVINCWVFKPTTTRCFMDDNAGRVATYFRFRFVSDTTTDTLAGWKIDSIKVQNPGCMGGAVTEVKQPNELQLLPNPASTSITISAGTMIQELTICNVLGQTVYHKDCNAKHVEVDIATLPRGMYVVRVNGNMMRRFVKE